MNFSLPGTKGTDWDTPERTTPEEAASRMLADRREHDAKVRLSWNRDRFPIRGDGKYVGGFKDEKGNHHGGVCLSLPSYLIDKKYYIQNCQIYLSNGDQTTLEKVFELENGGPCYLRVKAAFDRYTKEASLRDPAICRHCFTYRSTDQDDYAMHLTKEHADVVAGMMGLVSPAEEAARPTPYKCESCEQSFKNAGGLRLHTLKRHDRVA